MVYCIRILPYNSRKLKQYKSSVNNMFDEYVYENFRVIQILY